MEGFFIVCISEESDLMITTAVRNFLTLLCGEYSNQQQAFDNPPLYAHILLRYRPLEHLQPGSILLEQTYAVAQGTPYRLRMIRAEEQKSGVIKLWNHTFRDPKKFAAATFDPLMRREIQDSDLACLDECHYQVKWEENGYHGALEPGCRCVVRRDGKDTLLVSHFHLQGDELTTLDRGHDPISNEHCWGSVAGPFRFRRTEQWSSDIPTSW